MKLQDRTWSSEIQPDSPMLAGNDESSLPLAVGVIDA